MAPRDPSPRDARPARPREPGDAPRRDPARRFGPSSTRAATPQAPAPAPPEPPLDRPPPDQPSRLRRADLPPRDAPPRDAPPRETPARDRAEAPRRPARPDARGTPASRPARPERDEPTARTPNGARDPRPDRPRPSRPAPPPVDDEPPRRSAWPVAWRREPGAVPDAPARRGRGLRVVLTVLSVLVFALSGSAWAALSGSISTSNNAIGFTGDAADGATDILLVGVDSRTDAQGRPLPRDVLRELGAGQESGVVNTDTMILVRIPNDGSRAVAFSIPRDSYVSIPGAGRRDKINSAYPGAKAEAAQELVSSGVTDPREVDVRSSEAGRSELVKSVAQLTGLTVDHFAEVNLLGFYNLTNAIGGVNVCLKAKTDDDLSGAHFRAGPQSISGHDALAFVRQRHGLPQGDLDRIRRQQAFLAGLSNKVLSAGTLADPFTLSKLLGAVKESVVLDGGWDVLRFAQQMQGVSAGNVAFLTIPTEGTDTVGGRGDVVRVDPPAVQRFVADAIGPDDAAPEDDAPAPGTIPIDIRNASGTEGAAARVVAVLTAQGYARATSGNADDPARTSAVLFGPGADAAGGRVATSLGGLPTRFDPAVAPGTVRVLLASDYRGPGAAAAPPLFSGRSSATRAPAPPPAPAITADGVPCIA